MRTTRSTARLVGIFFLSAFLLYGGGSFLAMSSETLALGVGLMLMNSIAVIAIGALVLPTLRPLSSTIAKTYLASRIIEGLLLGAGAFALLAGGVQFGDVAYNVAMAVLGAGSLFFCAALYIWRLVPRPLAALGFVGYAIFAIGSVLELAGLTGAGLIAAIPGGLFELAFGVWLIAKGLRLPVTA